METSFALLYNVTENVLMPVNMPGHLRYWLLCQIVFNTLLVQIPWHVPTTLLRYIR